MILFLIIILLLFPVSAHAAIDKALGATNSFWIFVPDLNGVGIAGQTLGSGTGNAIDIRWRCIGDPGNNTINETGETWTEMGSGYYQLDTNDSISGCANEDEFLIWAFDQTGDVAVSPRLNKAIATTMGDIRWHTFNILNISEGGSIDPITTSFDSDAPYTIDVTNGAVDPILYFPTTNEDSTQSGSCNLQGYRVRATAFNSTTKIWTTEPMVVAPNAACVVRAY